MGKGPAHFWFKSRTRPEEWFTNWVRVLPSFVTQQYQTRGMVKGMGKGPAHDVLQVLHLLRWSTHLDKTNSTFCVQFMIMNVPCKFETTAFQGQKRKVTTTLFHHHGHVLQVHEGDQSSLPLQWLALLGKVITGGLAPLLKEYRTVEKSFQQTNK